MNMNPVEWSQVREVLIRQILTPSTERMVLASLFLSRCFVIPSGFMQDDLQPFLLRHPVRLLTTLHSVQKQVEQWIAEPPKEMEAEERPATHLSRSEIGARQPFPKETSSLSKQAQKLIDQVQDAIVKLATSTYIQDPQEVPLREALKKLKPNLDRIIDSMTQERERPLQPNTLSSFHHPIPASDREHVFANLASSTEKRPAPYQSPHSHPIQISSQSIAPAIQKDLNRSPVIEKKEAVIERNKIFKKRDVQSERGKEGAIQEKGFLNKKIVLPIDPPIEKQTHQQEQKGAKTAFKPLEAISLPSAPFLSQNKIIIAPRKKKKRKGFWFKGRDLEEDHNNS